ncbi:MAG TPA: hypothetical protein DCP69_04180 [Candidatus Omnitrophica bacterium]|nr:hypothetical protein [Candidatus Omnitrophota bacterium]
MATLDELAASIVKFNAEWRGLFDEANARIRQNGTVKAECDALRADLARVTAERNAALSRVKALEDAARAVRESPRSLEGSDAEYWVAIRALYALLAQPEPTVNVDRSDDWGLPESMIIRLRRRTEAEKVEWLIQQVALLTTNLEKHEREAIK